jgi:hypothetical protein
MNSLKWGHGVSIFSWRWLIVFGAWRKMFQRSSPGLDAEQPMRINKSDNSLFYENRRGCRLAWSRLVDLGSIDPGSNPGSPILDALFCAWK